MEAARAPNLVPKYVTCKRSNQYLNKYCSNKTMKKVKKIKKMY